VKELSWPDRCRERILPALDAVRVALEQHLTPNEVSAGAERPAVSVPSAPDATSSAALDLLTEAFELSAFETSVLLLCAGVELDGRIAALCARAQGEPRRRHASFGLALAALPGAHFGATAPVAPLRRWCLVRLDAGEGLADRPLRIDERVLHYLLGVSYLAPELEGVVTPCDDEPTLAPSQADTACRAAAVLRAEADQGRRPVLHLTGGSRSDRLAIARRGCRELGLALYTLSGTDLPADARQRGELARVWAREAVLSRSALLVEGDAGAGPQPAIASFLDVAPGMLWLSGDHVPELKSRRLIAVEVRLPSPAEQTVLWRGALDGAVPDVAIEPLVAQFSLSPDAIEELAAEARGVAPAEVPRRLWHAARRRARTSFGALAQSIEPRATLDLLVLPAAQKDTLRDIAAHVRQRQRVYETWGFAGRSSRGLGISALFSGPSGTGKTMAAEVLARELELELVHIDLSCVVSKYIGETERNLSRVFDAADRGGAILLFDEADALFGRRSEVKDSHDRYANVEVSYLLQRMEAYRGLAVLTSNQADSMDDAFLRRIRFVVRFPFPEEGERAEIWRQIFPRETPTAGLDAERLGRLNVPGGNIRNIALNAAFLAAEEQTPVGMRHCAHAARSELRKLGLTLPERELRGWQ
jgi:hypothetical protein